MLRQTLRIIDSALNYALLTAIVLLFAIAGYALWDSEQIYSTASQTNYTVYKPTPSDDGKSFAELQAINPEVSAWITVYGTHIDYPVAQSADNMKYVNTNAEGRYSLSGAIFLDSRNSSDYSDFNSILYGHHMEKSAMFGEIGSFADARVFDSHRFGNLYVDGTNYGVEFFCFLHVDAYDSEVFHPKIDRTSAQVYLDNLFVQAIHLREIGVTVNDRIIMLSTCSSRTTNGRDILVGKISSQTFNDTFQDDRPAKQHQLLYVDHLVNYVGRLAVKLWSLILIVVFLLLIVLLAVVHKQRKVRRDQLIQATQLQSLHNPERLATQEKQQATKQASEQASDQTPERDSQQASELSDHTQTPKLGRDK